MQDAIAGLLFYCSPVLLFSRLADTDSGKRLNHLTLNPDAPGTASGSLTIASHGKGVALDRSSALPRPYGLDER